MRKMHEEFGNTLLQELEYVIADADHFELPIRVLEAVKDAKEKIERQNEIILIERQGQQRVKNLIDDCAHKLRTAYCS